jgi:hypothetical protein
VDHPLDSYRQLLARLDAFFERAAARYTEEMRCRPGCDDCCGRDLELHAFEAACLVEAARALQPGARDRIRDRARSCLEDEEAVCPLLEEGRCVVYQARPVICRTHGLALLVPGDGSLSVCPHNFRGAEHIEGECVLDLDPVNRILTTVSALLSRAGEVPAARVLVSRALIDGAFGEGRD